MQRSVKVTLGLALGLIVASPLLAQGKASAAGGGKGGGINGGGIKGAPRTAPGRTTPGMGTFYGGYGQTPWFNNSGIRQQLNLNNNQFSQLGQAYGQAWNSNFGNSANNPGLNNLNNTLNQFNSQFGKSAQGILSPQQYQRLQQLNWQYQGYGAFNNPTIQQKLNLTQEQMQKLNTYGQAYEKNFNNLYKSYSQNPQSATKQYNTYRQEMNRNINSVLTPEQRQMWQQMTGNPYQFGLPFQSGTTGGTNGGTTGGGTTGGATPPRQQ